jgi:ABC-2 type transport system ATP-binding protein
VVVDHGRVVAAGSPAELVGAQDTLHFNAPAGLDLAALRAGLGDEVAAVESAPGRYAVSHRDGRALEPEIIAGVTAWCATTGIRPDGLTLGRRTLEDVFLDLTGRALR